CSQTTWNEPTDLLHGIMAPPDEQYLHTGLSHDPQVGLSLDPTFDLDFGAAGSNSHMTVPDWPSTFAPSAASHDFYHPIYHSSRLAAAQDAWNPLQVTGVPSQSTMSHMCMADGDHEAGFKKGHYRTPSETGSKCLGSLYSGDSGYGGTSCDTGSVVPSPYGIDSLSSPMAGSHEQTVGESIAMFNRAFMDSAALLEDMTSSLVESVKCDHPTCTWVGKCPSDKRKHEARHRKLFKCDEPHCPRKEGFGTINDLARHKKCVHNKEPERGPKMMYLCFGMNCPRPNKLWPRQDNFKQHLSRMHHGEDADALLKKSMEWYESSGQLAHGHEDAASEDSSNETQQDLVHSNAAEVLSVSCTDSSLEDVDAIPSNLATPRPMSNCPTLAQSGHSHLDSFPSFTIDDHSITAGQEPTKSATSITHAADNLINAMTKMMNNRARRSSQYSDEGIEIESGSTNLSPPERQMLQKILSTALERLSDEQIPSSADAGLDNDKQDWFRCDVCPKRTRLRCEMKKHQKRHERPYGCTFPQCAKSFGSKADWKRHETSQHLSIPSWLCTLHDPAKNSACDHIFYREEMFAQHLHQTHRISKTKTTSAVHSARLDVAQQSQFWCGFCAHFVPLRTSGSLALDERFNHIDTEHFKKGVRGMEWQFPSASVTGGHGLAAGGYQSVTALERGSRKRKLAG
ncbi:hypothetical protein N7539_003085, partial [Penicillium diatomitis]